jgi:hypothetical protein
MLLEIIREQKSQDSVAARTRQRDSRQKQKSGFEEGQSCQSTSRRR